MRRRIDELDGLRGIAALCVVFYHYTYRFYEKFGIETHSEFSFSYGKYGVELFFIISGFVIFMSVEKIKSPFEFIYKRFIRLFPTFWICMVLTFIVMGLYGNEIMKVNFKEFIMNFTMIPSAFDIKAVDGVYWTLKIEMFFYTFILALIVFRKTDLINHIGFLYILASLTLLIIPKLNEYYYYGTLFLIGINFYKLWNGEGKFHNHLQIFLCALLALLAWNSEVLIVTIILVAIFYLFLYQKLGFLATSPFIFLGKISFALYLVHQNIGYLFQLELLKLGYTNQILLVAVPLLVSLFIASAITLLIEKPLLGVLTNYYKVRIDKNISR